MDSSQRRRLYRRNMPGMPSTRDHIGCFLFQLFQFCFYGVPVTVGVTALAPALHVDLIGSFPDAMLGHGRISFVSGPSSADCSYSLPHGR